ncbi:alpha/beta fold hydrolase [Oricola cellulosilytica]|nr:alpha/beta hydrolase [Oricola cellulosilytica]
MLPVPGGVVSTWLLPATTAFRGRVLLVHGWNSRSAHLVQLAAALTSSGMEAVLLDLPGHGASSGRHLHMGKGIEAIDAAWRHYGGFNALVGHSFGGAVALNAAVGALICVPARVPETLVMLAAPNSLPAFFRWFGRQIGLPRAAQESFERKVLHILGRSIETIVGAEQLKEFHRPVLLVHDMDDKDVLYADALRMARAGSHVRLHTTNGLGHRRILKSADVHRVVCDHLRGAGAGTTPLELAGNCA